MGRKRNFAPSSAASTRPIPCSYFIFANSTMTLAIGFRLGSVKFGSFSLGVVTSTVVAQSFERIHRSNLVGMGVLPLQFREGVTAQTLGLHGTEMTC